MINTPIVNRAGKLEAGWYDIETAGEHLNRASGLVQVLDNQAFDAIVNRFQQEAAGENFAGLLIDRDHFSLDADKTSESFGWLMQLRNREGHLEGRIDWSDEGDRAVKGKRFKFFSTVYDPADCEQIGTRRIANRDYPLIRPLRLDRLALTNDPNNKGGKPISNRTGKPADAGEKQTEPTMKNMLKELGLAEDAPEASAIAEVQKIKNRATSAEAERDTLKIERDALLNSQVEATLEKHKGVIKNREAWAAHLKADLRGATTLLEGIAEAAPALEVKPITNRGTAQMPGATSATSQAEKESVRGAKIANRAIELRKMNSRLTRSQAFAKAAAEFPAD
jgi:hypothetical protein